MRPEAHIRELCVNLPGVTWHVIMLHSVHRDIIFAAIGHMILLFTTNNLKMVVENS